MTRKQRSLEVLKTVYVLDYSRESPCPCFCCCFLGVVDERVAYGLVGVSLRVSGGGLEIFVQIFDF